MKKIKDKKMFIWLCLDFHQKHNFFLNQTNDVEGEIISELIYLEFCSNIFYTEIIDNRLTNLLNDQINNSM